jgi:hypothetical protein
MKLRVLGLTVCCMLAMAGEARAQVVWDSPTLIPPRAPAGTGIYLIDTHGARLGVLGTWRAVTNGTGFRLGVSEGRGGDGIAVFGGVDFVTPLVTVSPDFPLDISWFTGVGAGYADWLVISVPLGITLGRTVGAPDVRFTPYLAPKVIADVHLGRGPGNDNELALNLDVDLGFDIQFPPGWMIRIGAGLGNRSGLAVGILF